MHRVNFGFFVLGKIIKLGFKLSTMVFSTLINGICIEGKIVNY